MDTNCLVTKFKESTGNNDWERLGEIKLVAKKLSSIGNSLQQTLSISYPPGTPYTIRTYGNGYFSLTLAGLDDPSLRLTELNANGTGNLQNYYFKNDDYDVFVGNKYKIMTFVASNGGVKRLHLFNFDLSAVEYMKNLISFDIGGSYNITGDIKHFAGLLSLRSLNLSICTNITGNISHLGNLSQLPSSYMYIGNTNIGGNLEDFVGSQISAGNTTVVPFKTATIFASNIKFYGYGRDEIYSPYFVSPTSQITFIEWNTINKIIVYCYTTSQPISATYTDCDLIYAKGATAEEIAAWKSASKTVFAYENNEWVEK